MGESEIGESEKIKLLVGVIHITDVISLFT
jgi:hypothetical protein